MLEFDGLTRRYGDVVALNELTVEVPVGQVVGFLGPNGAGKTTAMRAAFRLVRLDAGEVRWSGRRVDRNASRRFGYMPEERGLYPGMVISDQLRYLAQLHGLDADAAASATTQWLERLGVADRAGSKVEELSLGNQQRVQLAAALAHDPEMLILDEPLSGLDPVGIDEVSAVLTEQAAAGRGVLLSSHQLDLVEDVCTSVVIIDHGRLVASGTVEELATRGNRRLAVAVAGDPDGAWARSLSGVTDRRSEGGIVRLTLEPSTDDQAVLAAAMRAGPVTHFAFERRRLSEVFREALAGES